MAEKQGLDRLPPEIFYYNLVPYLTRYDIFALRQVNKYFNEVFSSDDCWKQFVYYPLKYILCDLKSRSTVAGVAEVLHDILQQEGHHRWLDYCKLQEAHLNNWVSGRNMLFDTINLPLRGMAYMEEIVDDNSEHWLCFSVCKTLCIWNITAQTQSLGAFNVGQHRLVRLLPCRKVLVQHKESCIISVYNISPEENTLKHNVSFRFDEDNPRSCRDLERDPGNYLQSIHFQFILMNHIFIGYLCQLRTPQDCLLHLWNLNDNHCKPKQHTAKLTEIINCFEAFLSENGVNTKQKHNLSLFKSNSQYAIVVLKLTFHRTTFSQLNLFDISSRHFTHLIAQTSSDFVSCSMFHNKIFIDEKIFSQAENSLYSRVSVFSVPQAQAGNTEIDQALKMQVNQAVPLQGQCLYRFNFKNLHSVVLKESKMFIRTNNEVVIILTDPMFHRLEISMNAGYKILGFIEPKILLMYDSYRNPKDTEVRVYNIFNQRLVRSWDRVNIDESRFKHYFSNLVYPSKLILNIESQDQLRIYNF